MKKIYLFILIVGCYGIQAQSIQNDSNKQTVNSKQGYKNNYHECKECGQLFESSNALRFHTMIGPYRMGCTGKPKRMIIFNNPPVAPEGTRTRGYRPAEENEQIDNK